MELTVKRQELGGLESMILSAKADKAYAGSANFGATSADGELVTVTVTVLDESDQS